MSNSKIKALILDMDGVLWRNKEPIGNLSSIFKKINHLGLKYVFATNNSMNTVDEYVKFLNLKGVDVIQNQIFTSATATAQFLKSKFPTGGNIYVVGMTGLEKTIQQYGFNIGKSDSLAVVVGMDRNLTFEKLRTATLLIRNGALFIGTNPDKTFPSPEGQIPGAGSMIAAVEASTGSSPEIIGKPKPTMFFQALEFLGEEPENVLVVGDRLETDIAGGQAAKCKCALVLSGVSTRAMGVAWAPKVDFIADDLASLISSL